ncbi:50S ribosomal protein L7/L12 [Alteromonas mediterranea U7]|uniref:50S ribosomal protein L7/L12 n=1 Tax=Alteromonas mediterranea (strain DSM 17117 / CIP 110805 / LMG 28347 / Deep ecotype) TaxID=1774373 RepID=T2DLZ8_ALTMD|nr:50S ribosomal protein L7/L12 [Alteromonas mediterranea U7]AGP95205.1 50S ribosomal protein L7/L12 [Alteromonas mediterranea U8]AGP99201.1 50S ribosomal protein L7/L12 [Alteromonas mediterranea UM7]AGV53914.1 50S ribosomal protein L7/L12 [Alteromonas mediterranea DE]
MVQKTTSLAVSGNNLTTSDYLISTSAPASSSSFLSASASSLLTPSLIALGADSTTSLASLRPRPVAPRTALITATLLPPNEVITTSNSVFSSAAAASPPAAGPATATAAAADTLNFSSAASISSTSSITGISAIAFKISSLVRAMFSKLLGIKC